MIVMTPEPLDPADLDAAAEVLVRSFKDDPGLHFVLPHVADQQRLGPTLARAMVRYVLRCGAPLATPDIVRGVALWLPPDAPEPTVSDLAKRESGRSPS